MTTDEINKRKNTVLTNFFTGQKIMSESIGNNALTPRFGFSIKNNNASESKSVALFSGCFDFTEQIVNEQVKNGMAKGYSTIKQGINDLLSSAGYPVDAVLATLPEDQDNDLVIVPNDSKKSIESFKRYFRSNPHFIKNIIVTIGGNDPNAFSSVINFQNKMYPFKSMAKNEIDMTKYYDRMQYSQNKIEIPFAEGEVEISDQLWMDICVPADTTYKIVIELYTGDNISFHDKNENYLGTIEATKSIVLWFDETGEFIFDKQELYETFILHPAPCTGGGSGMSGLRQNSTVIEMEKTDNRTSLSFNEYSAPTNIVIRLKTGGEFLVHADTMLENIWHSICLYNNTSEEITIDSFYIWGDSRSKPITIPAGKSFYLILVRIGDILLIFGEGFLHHGFVNNPT